MITRLFFLVALLLIVSAIGRALRKPREPRGRVSSAPPRLDDRMERDPVCGTFVARSGAPSAGGHVFCSDGCRRRYLSGAE